MFKKRIKNFDIANAKYLKSIFDDKNKFSNKTKTKKVFLSNSANKENMNKAFYKFFSANKIKTALFKAFSVFLAFQIPITSSLVSAITESHQISNNNKKIVDENNQNNSKILNLFASFFVGMASGSVTTYFCMKESNKTNFEALLIELISGKNQSPEEFKKAKEIVSRSDFSDTSKKNFLSIIEAIRTAREEKINMTETIRTVQEEKQNLQNKNLKLSSEIKILKETNAEQEKSSKIEGLEQEVEKLNEQIKNQTKNLEQQQEGQKQLEQQVEKLENQIQTLAKEKQNLQEENESTISELSSEIKTLKETNTEQEKSSKIEGLEQEVEKLNEQIETFDKEKQNLQNRIKELESTINEIQDIEKLKVIVKNISIPIKLKENFTECSENDSVENLERLKERNQMLLEVLGEKNDEIESLKKQKENLINISTNTDGTKKKFEHTPDPTNDPTKYTLDSTKMSEANPFKPLNNKTNKPPPPPSSSKPKVTSNDLKRIVGIRTDETKKTLELSSSKPKGEIGFPLSSTSEANPFKSPTDK